MQTEATFPGGRPPKTFTEFKTMIAELYGEKWRDTDLLWSVIENDALRQLKRITPYLDLDTSAPLDIGTDWQEIGEWMDIQGHYHAYCRQFGVDPVNFVGLATPQEK